MTYPHRNLKQWHIVTFLVSTATEAVIKIPLCSYLQSLHNVIVTDYTVEDAFVR